MKSDYRPDSDLDDVVEHNWKIIHKKKQDIKKVMEELQQKKLKALYGRRVTFHIDTCEDTKCIDTSIPD